MRPKTALKNTENVIIVMRVISVIAKSLCINSQKENESNNLRFCWLNDNNILPYLVGSIRFLFHLSGEKYPM